MGLALMLVVSSAAADSPRTAGHSTESGPVTVAVLVPLDGPLASMGQQLLEAAEFGARNADVEVIGVDAGETPQDTLQAVQELAGRSEIAAVVGPIRRQHARPAARAAARHQLPLIAYSSQHGVEDAGPAVFRARLSASEQSRALASYIADELEIDDVGVMGPHSGYGDEFTPAIVDAVNDAGGRVRSLSRYDENTTDFRRPLGVLNGSRVYVGTERTVGAEHADRWGTVDAGRAAHIDFEALIIADVHDVVARLLPFLPGAGISTSAESDGADVQLLGLSGWRGDGLQRASEHARGAVFFDTFGGDRDGSVARQFIQEFRAATDREATTPEAEIYDLLGMIGERVDAELDHDERRERLVDGLRSGESEYEGVTGDWEFEWGGAPIRRLQPYQVTAGGDWVGVGGSRR